MNQPHTRRAFLAEVSKGTLLATIGPALAAEFGISSAHAAETSAALHFGDLEPLVAFMQETPVAKLQTLLAAKLQKGTPLEQLVAAGVLPVLAVLAAAVLAMFAALAPFAVLAVRRVRAGGRRLAASAGDEEREGGGDEQGAEGGIHAR